MAHCECGMETIRVNGITWSRHLENGQHWARLRSKNGTKPKQPAVGSDDMGLTENSSQAEVLAALSKRDAEMR